METNQHSCKCPCGTNKFSAVGDPIVRFFCHCTICQDKYQAPFADVTLFKLPAVRLPKKATTNGKYKRFAAIDRGICDACHKPVMAKMGAGDKGYAFISTRNFDNPDTLPPSALHVFYGTRQANVDDALPKYNSWLSSQWAFLKLLRAADQTVQSIWERAPSDIGLRLKKTGRDEDTRRAKHKVAMKH